MAGGPSTHGTPASHERRRSQERSDELQLDEDLLLQRLHEAVPELGRYHVLLIPKEAGDEPPLPSRDAEAMPSQGR